MNRRLRKTALVFVVAAAAAQLIRPGRVNQPTDPSRTIQAHMGTGSPLIPILNRACADCHSNGTVWPWYTKVAPFSWVMAYGVIEGRKAVNFSEWAAYPAESQRGLLAASCRDASEGRMPDRSWTWLHPEARLSRADVETICTAAQQDGTDPTGGH